MGALPVLQADRAHVDTGGEGHVEGGDYLKREYKVVMK